MTLQDPRRRGEARVQEPPPRPVVDALVDLFVKNAHTLSAADALASYLKENCYASGLVRIVCAARQSSWVVSDRGQVQSIVGDGIHLPEAPTTSAELPNTAAFLGGTVAQETIKVITKQYIPVKGYCVIDLVDTWTGVISA
ncbi:hypothetical protein L210DRAFT_3643286 [Boletus edulis BED1]|uniref:Uncharacterized protein n=1 Tax=Boletus edulis BED1 TaxID=1328754 RepID=A0AAD4BZG4_BOLED|nr:hypothetical protein L210DRAFT_3643286 [Boletus edulis BED1]